MKKLVLAVSLSTLGFSTACADADIPSSSVIGGHGFDWLHPLSARCKQITRQDADKLKNCKFEKAGGSFGLGFPYFSCRVNRNVEYLVYLTEPACVEAKETMEANAP